MKPAVYTRTMQLFHWSGALLILGLWLLGVVMHEMADTPLKTQLYRVHVGIGLLTLILTVARIVWLFVGKRPEDLAMPAWRRLAFVWNHRLLYLIVALLLVSGVGMLVLSGIGISLANVIPAAIQDVPPRTVHGIASKLFLALFVMHFVGVVHYQFTEGETFARMGVALKRR